MLKSSQALGKPTWQHPWEEQKWWWWVNRVLAVKLRLISDCLGWGWWVFHYAGQFRPQSIGQPKV
ncbi:MAG: hypothetical protein U0930_15680 [Pirellulales bacterium]